jgi:hypothetical protein
MNETIDVSTSKEKKLILCGDWNIYFHINLRTVLDLGHSHHHAKILCIHVENPKGRLVRGGGAVY